MIIKRYKNPAFRQKIILDAFQRAGWPEEVLDPFGCKERAQKLEMEGKNPKAEINDLKSKRRETIKQLNKTQDRIMFVSGGDGFAVRWKWRS